MKKYGKYEKQPEGVAARQPKVKSMLLQTYFTSLLCMVLCVTMFLGTTYAWFTSEVTNEGNEIYIGTLDVGLYKVKDGEEVSLDSSVSSEKLFDDGIRWEPGYTALETVTIKNEGQLAFRYELTFTENGEVEITLADVAQWFDVWCYHDSQNAVPTPENYEQITEENGWTKVGSLDDVLNGKPVLLGSMTKDDVAADPKTAHTYTIALHMKGEKGLEEGQQKDLNSLMGQRISLNVKLVATQLSGEKDAFGATYDLEAFADTLAQVNGLENKTIDYYWGIDGNESMEMTLDTAYQFLPNDTLEEAQASAYRYYIADFVVKANEDVPGNSVALAGYYDAWCQYKNYHWIALTTSDVIEADTEIRLVESMGGGGISVNYEELCRYGNDGTGFLCGAADMTGENAGTTLTVELRLYETYSEEECFEKFGEKSTNKETGRYITVGKYEYTFPEKTITP